MNFFLRELATSTTAFAIISDDLSLSRSFVPTCNIKLSGFSLTDDFTWAFMQWTSCHVPKLLSKICYNCRNYCHIYVTIVEILRDFPTLYIFYCIVPQDYHSLIIAFLFIPVFIMLKFIRLFKIHIGTRISVIVTVIIHNLTGNLILPPLAVAPKERYKCRKYELISFSIFFIGQERKK